LLPSAYSLFFLSRNQTDREENSTWLFITDSIAGDTQAGGALVELPKRGKTPDLNFLLSPGPNVHHEDWHIQLLFYQALLLASMTALAVPGQLTLTITEYIPCSKFTPYLPTLGFVGSTTTSSVYFKFAASDLSKWCELNLSLSSISMLLHRGHADTKGPTAPWWHQKNEREQYAAQVNPASGSSGGGGRGGGGGGGSGLRNKTAEELEFSANAQELLREVRNWRRDMSDPFARLLRDLDAIPITSAGEDLQDWFSKVAFSLLLPNCF